MDLTQIQNMINNAGVGAYYTGQNQALSQQEQQAKIQNMLKEMILKQQAEARAQALLPSQIDLNKAQAQHQRASADYSSRGLLPYQQVLTERERGTMPSTIKLQAAQADERQLELLSNQQQKVYDWLSRNPQGLEQDPLSYIDKVHKMFGVPSPVTQITDDSGKTGLSTDNLALRDWLTNPRKAAEDWIASDPEQRKKIAQENVRGAFQIGTAQIGAQSRENVAKIGAASAIQKAGMMQTAAQKITSLIQSYMTEQDPTEKAQIYGLIEAYTRQMDNETQQAVSKTFGGRIPDLPGITQRFAPPAKPPVAEPGAKGAPTQQQAPRVTNETEYNALPSKSLYLDARDGKVYKKP